MGSDEQPERSTTVTASLTERLPRWVLLLGPFVVLGSAITILLVTSPLGDLAAIETASTAEVLWIMALIGVIVGLVPVAIGMLWFPFLRTIDPSRLHVVLAFSAGVLAFVAVEMLTETIDYARATPSTTLAVVLAVVGFLGTFGVMVGISRISHRHLPQDTGQGLNIAYLVALGLGLHSLGEGIAIGAALLIGEVSLATLLIIGFLLDNVTEGPTVVAAVAHDLSTPPLGHFVALGTIAGGPVVLGGWIAVVAFSPLLAAALLAIGIGAIAQVIWEVIDLIRIDAPRLLTWQLLAGFLGGFGFMLFLDEVLIETIVI